MRRVLLISHRYVNPANRGKPRALAARGGGLEVTVVVPQRWREPVLSRLVETSWERQSGVEVFPVQASHPGDSGSYRFASRVLLSLFRDKRPELVQIEEDLSTAVARQAIAAAWGLGIPVVLGVTENIPKSGGLFGGWRRRRALGRLRGAVAASEAAATLVRHDAPNLPVAVLPQLGVSVPSAPDHQAHAGLSLGFVGRLVHRKGMDTLLEALARHRELAWTLTVVGDGPERVKLEALASTRRLAARIRWAGALSANDLPKIWPLLDVLVQPSRSAANWREPTGHTIAEAMAHEVAVIGTAAGASPEVIGDSGLVVAPDDPTALAEAIGQMADPLVRRPFAEAARARALKLYSDEAVAERTLEFWDGDSWCNPGPVGPGSATPRSTRVTSPLSS